MKSKYKDDIDMFAIDIPMFNFEGRPKIGTSFGTFCSIVLKILLLGLTTVKFIHLVTGNNPDIATSELHGQFTSNQTGLLLKDFKIAFKVSDFMTNLPLDAPNMVKWQVTIVESSGIDVWQNER